MDFVYDLETFDNGVSHNKIKETDSGSMSLKLGSMSTSDFTKKLQSLSILDIARGGIRGSEQTEKNKSLDSSHLTSNAQSLKRARLSIELLNSLGFDYNPFEETLNASQISDKSVIDNDDLTDVVLSNSRFDGKSLVNKLTKVLESSDGYDASIKHSLGILERRIEYEISLENNKNKNSKFNSSNDSKTDPIDNLKHLTSIGQAGNLARRNLRGLIEEDLLHQYSTQLRNFQKIVKSIENVRPNLQVITNEYNDLLNSINNSIDSSKKLKDEISSLDEEKKLIDLKKNILVAFKSTFTITHYEEHLIRYADLNDYTTGVEFFKSIDKIKKIQNNCDVLLGMENEKLGLNIMRQMSELLLSVNERINSYVKNNIDYVYSGGSTSLQPSNIRKKIDIPTFQKSLIYLWKNDKTNFDSIISSMVGARSRSIANEFINQLRGYTEEVNQANTLMSSSSSTAATDRKSGSRLFLSSYDTVRFISDTLAYIHSVLVNEIENSRSFLTFDFMSDNENKELEDLVSSVAIDIISGLNKPLKGAIESVLRQESKITTIVNCHDLLELYLKMFSKLLYPEKSAIDSLTATKKYTIMIVMNELSIETQERVFSLIKLKLKNLEVEAAQEDLNTSEDGEVLPDWIVEWCAFIDDLFSNQNNKNGLDNDNEHILGLNDDQWKELLKFLIDTPLELIRTIQEKSDIDKKEKLIWKLNCVDYMFNRIDINPSLANKSEYLDSLILADANALTELEFAGLLKSSGLYDIYNLINMIFKLDDEFFDVSFYEPILENKLFNAETFQTANQKLEQFFAGYINQNELSGLMSPKLFNKVFFDSSMNFIEFYRKLSLIVNEYLVDKDGNKIKVFQWDEMSIATVLGIEDYYQEHQ